MEFNELFYQKHSPNLSSLLSSTSAVLKAVVVRRKKSIHAMKGGVEHDTQPNRLLEFSRKPSA